MQCPVCGGDMYDNTKNKRNPSAPDYRCKDKECKYTLNPDTGEYEEGGDYPTGVWLPKKKPAKQAPATKPANGNGNEIRTDAMIMAYAKDLCVAWINQGQEVTPERVVDVYGVLKSAL